MFWRRQAVGETPLQRIPFFTLRDYLAAGTAALLAFIAYLWTLAPSVTLEDSGELITAAYQLGVAHPPGYPVWTLAAFVWQKVFPFGNIAWRLNLLSAICAALAVGLTALLVSRSSHVLLARLGLWRRLPDPRAGNLFIMTSAVAAALLLGFSTVLWSQAVITEVYSMQALCLLLLLTGLYRWSFDPESRWRLYLTGFIWGIGLTVHQTLALVLPALPFYIWLIDRRLGRDLLMPLLAASLLAIGVMFLVPGSIARQGMFPAMLFLLAAGGAGWWLWRLWRERRSSPYEWQTVVCLVLAVLAGLSFYLYEPIASATNPPLNWGYTRTWGGFLHHLTRGQYEPVQTARGLLQFWGQINMFLSDLQSEFNILYALIGLLPWLVFRELTGNSRDWLRFLLATFFCLGLGFLFFSNPSFEKQKQFTERVFFLSAHCVYALWIGYGLALGAGWVCVRATRWRLAAIICAVTISILPVVSLRRNGPDASQRGHDYGYRLGYSIFEPGGTYGTMDSGAVLFGGTDSGRFVASHMIFVESRTHAKTRGTDFDRHDVYLLTQNALTEQTYRQSLRDQYGANRPSASVPATLADRPGWQNIIFWNTWYLLGRDRLYPDKPLVLPSEEDVDRIFRETGSVAANVINSELTRWIFERNREQHTFYVEESFVMPWMYDYAEPYGIIFRLQPRATLRLPPQVLVRDQAYWSELTRQLLSDKRFEQDAVAQRTFAKLRANIGGLYAHRGYAREAERALRQALTLSAESEDATYRLAQLCAREQRYDEAMRVLTDYLRRDRFNSRILDAVVQLQKMRERPSAPAFSR